MSNAYLLTANGPRGMLEDLFRYTWSEPDYFVIHASRNAPAATRLFGQALAAVFPNVRLLPSRHTSWGGWSQTQLLLDAAALALREWTDWSHFIPLSDRHLPLHAPADRARLLESAVSYCQATRAIEMQPVRREDVLNRLEWVWPELQGVGHFAVGPRALPKDFMSHLFQGLGDVILAREACARVVDVLSKEPMRSIFSTSPLSEQTAIQTVIHGVAHPEALRAVNRAMTFIAPATASGMAAPAFSEADFVHARDQGHGFILGRPAQLPASIHDQLEAGAELDSPTLRRMLEMAEIETTEPPSRDPAAIAAAVANELSAIWPGVRVTRIDPSGTPNVPELDLTFASERLPDDIAVRLLSGNLTSYKVMLTTRASSDATFQPRLYENQLCYPIRAWVWDLFGHFEIPCTTDRAHGFGLLETPAHDLAADAVAKHVAAHLDHAERIGARRSLRELTGPVPDQAAPPADTGAPLGVPAIHGRRSIWESDKLEAIRSFTEFCQGRELPQYPLEVFLEVSNLCNLKCAMCADFSAINPHRFQTLQSQNRTMMSPSELNENFASLLKNALFVHCSGFGESTIHPQFREIVRLVSSYDVMIHFITNGQELNTDLSEFLVEQGVYKIMVSASGSTREEYEQVYIGGKFDKLLDGLRRLRDVKRARGTRYPLVEINSLGFKHHVASFDKFVELMIDCGADIIHLKKLQPYNHIPELFEHVSFMRPWVEGVILQRAFALGSQHGVIVSADEYLHNTVNTEEEYHAAIDNLKHAADDKLSFAEFGNNTIETFASLVRPAKPSSPVSKVSRPIIHPNDDPETALRLLDVRDLEEGRPDDERFYCMEPFKTAYVANNGGLRPCCFSGNQHPYLGSLRQESGIDAWRGTGFSVVQKSVLGGRYPTDMCQRCLRDRIGPSTHNIAAMFLDYVEWYQDRFKSDLSIPLERVAPSAIKIASNSPPTAIARRCRHEELPVPVGANARRDLDVILRAATEIPEVDASVAGLLEGWFERVENNHAVGWIWSPAFPSAHVPIRVWHAGELLIEGTACLPRPDLLHVGKGDGDYGFSLPLPPRPCGWEKKDLELTIGDRPGLMRLLA